MDEQLTRWGIHTSYYSAHSIWSGHMAGTIKSSQNSVHLVWQYGWNLSWWCVPEVIRKCYSNGKGIINNNNVTVLDYSYIATLALKAAVKSAIMATMYVT